MAQRAYVPFTSRPAITPVALPANLSPTQQLSGVGSPESEVPGIAGQTYIDSSTGNLYIKMEGVQATGWRLIGVVSPGGGAGVGGNNIFYATADPNGVIQATGPAICIGAGAQAGAVWVKSTSGSSSNEWDAIIAVP